MIYHYLYIGIMPSSRYEYNHDTFTPWDESLPFAQTCCKLFFFPAENFLFVGKRFFCIFFLQMSVFWRKNWAFFFVTKQTTSVLFVLNLHMGACTKGTSLCVVSLCLRVFCLFIFHWGLLTKTPVWFFDGKKTPNFVSWAKYKKTTKCTRDGFSRQTSLPITH